MTSSQLRGFSRKDNSLSWRCQFQKISSYPSDGNNHKSPFQENVPLYNKIIPSEGGIMLYGQDEDNLLSAQSSEKKGEDISVY